MIMTDCVGMRLESFRIAFLNATRSGRDRVVFEFATFSAKEYPILDRSSYGSIGDWMYRKAAGLSQLEPGYKKFQVKPMFVKGIEEWGTEFESVYGKIVANTSWQEWKNPCA